MSRCCCFGQMVSCEGKLEGCTCSSPGHAADKHRHFDCDARHGVKLPVLVPSATKEVMWAMAGRSGRGRSFTERVGGCPRGTRRGGGCGLGCTAQGNDGLKSSCHGSRRIVWVCYVALMGEGSPRRQARSRTHATQGREDRGPPRVAQPRPVCAINKAMRLVPHAQEL